MIWGKFNFTLRLFGLNIKDEINKNRLRNRINFENAIKAEDRTQFTLETELILNMESGFRSILGDRFLVSLGGSF